MSESVVALLARLRVFLGFVFGAIVLWRAEPTPVTLVVGAAIASVGEVMRIWAAGHLHKSREVTRSGPYRWCAHPLYVGSSVMGAGLAIASGRLLATVLVAVYLVVTLTAAVKSEEAFLRRRFGDRYDRYRRGDLAKGDDRGNGGDVKGDGDTASDRARGNRRFSVAQAITNREHRALIGFLLAVLLLALKATYN